MSVGSDLLECGDVGTVPVEKETEGGVDETSEDGWVEDGLPHDG